MKDGTLHIDGRKYRIVPEDQYKRMRQAVRAQERQAKEDAADVRATERRLNDPKHRTIPWERLADESQLCAFKPARSPHFGWES